MLLRRDTGTGVQKLWNEHVAHHNSFGRKHDCAVYWRFERFGNGPIRKHNFEVVADWTVIEAAINEFAKQGHPVALRFLQLDTALSEIRETLDRLSPSTDEAAAISKTSP